MIRRSHPHKEQLRYHSFGWARYMVIMALLVTMSTACSVSTPEKPPAETIDLATDVLSDKNILPPVQRVDTDSDGKLEWLVFYRYDQVEQSGPVGAYIYDVASAGTGQLPVVYPYKLRTPAQNYLAQGQPQVALVDLVPETSGAQCKELVFSTNTELAFFRVNNSGVNLPSDDPPLYHCIGFFRSDVGVAFNPDNRQVTVTRRAGFERSQLVIRDYYMPETDGYFVNGTDTLLSPMGSMIDFPSGIPADILDTPYPEKIVLAFYKTFGKSNASPTIVEYLTTAATNDFMSSRLKYGSPYSLEQVKTAVVKELSYYPTQEDSQSTVVTVKVVFNSTDGQRSNLTEVRWTLIREQNRWKMQMAES